MISAAAWCVRSVRRWVAVGAAAWLLSASYVATAAVPPRAKSLAFVGVTVIPMDTERRLDNQTVLIANGAIQRIAPAAELHLPRGTIRIDGRGKYLIPGLSDMHGHLSEPRDLLLNLANGVTFVRAMWGEQPILDLRDGVRDGRLLGPRVFVGSRIVDGKPPWHFGTFGVVDQADAERVVLSIKTQGYDFIKVYSVLTPPAYAAIAAAARRERIRFGGHAPLAVPLPNIFAAGQWTIEHLTGFTTATERDGPPLGLDVFFQMLGTQSLAKLGRGELTLEQAFDARKLETIAAQAAKSSTWNVPTLVVIRSSTAGAEHLAREAGRVEMRFVQPAVREMWKFAESYFGGSDPDVAKGKRLLYQQHLQQVRALHRAGAGLLAGTDTPNPYVFQGASVHDELRLLVEAGLPQFAALRTATANVSEAMNEKGQWGALIEGARADLLLLEADPLADIGNTRRIAGVMAGGRWLTRAELERRVEPIAAEIAAQDRRFAAAPPLSMGDAKKPAANVALQVLRNGRDVGAERYAVWPEEEGARRIVAQVLGPLGRGGGTTYEYELAAKGAFRSLTIRSIGSSASRRIEPMPDCDTIATGTPADAASLAELWSSIDEGASKTRSVCVVGADGRGDVRRETWSITREPLEAIRYSGFLTAGKKYRIRTTSGGDSRERVIWLGGGFFEGQFLAGEDWINGKRVSVRSRFL